MRRGGGAASTSWSEEVARTSAVCSQSGELCVCADHGASLASGPAASVKER
jgi:hypothetical protein